MSEPMSMPVPEAAPHAHDRSSVDVIMRHVCLALTPLTLFAFYLFGWPAIFLWALACVTAILTELLCLYLTQKPLTRIYDGSALLTGWLLALTLPPYAPWWIAVSGAAFALIVGKHIYGGIGQNLFNPAMLARVALLVCFPVQMTTWADVAPINVHTSPDEWMSLEITFQARELADGMTGATLLGAVQAGQNAGMPMSEIMEENFSLFDALVGFTRGSMGETSAILVLIGALWLFRQRILTWHIPVSMISTVAILAAIFHGLKPEEYLPPMAHLFSGSLIIGAFFFATDYVTAPSSPIGKIVFGIGIGAVCVAIRNWGGFPEGVAFAILFMNAFTPLIDRYLKPRAYGRHRSGKAIEVVKPARRVR